MIDVVNDLTRLRPSRRERFRVTIFGSARVQPGSAAYDITRRTAQTLAEMGCDIVTGGGPGLMQAANEGAAAVPGSSKSVGIRIALPFEQDVNAFVTQAFEDRTFFTRLHQFVLTSDAFVVAPGGIGTVLESIMVWQLLQVRHIENTPLIFVGWMWPGLVDWARSTMLSVDPPLASPADCDAWIATPKGLALIERRPMTLAEKARFFEAEIDLRHRRTPYEYIHPVVLKRTGDKSDWVQTDSDNDGLWTSMYGAAESFACAATRSEEACRRAKKAFDAMRFLNVVTQGGSNPAPPGFVARSILPVRARSQPARERPTRSRSPDEPRPALEGHHSALAQER